MRKQLFAAIITILCLILPGTAVQAEEEAPSESELYAKSAVLMDADSGRILYEKNGSEALANASTTKILTCILALENGNLANEVEVSALAASQPKVHLGMRQGQKFYLNDLLYGLMLESYNDCAVAIAEHIAGSVENFAALMNRKAKEIGCKDTYFITPNGLDATDETGFHHTTAADLALIMRYCISQSEKSADFLEITRTAQYQFSDVTGSASYSCYNHNAFLQMMDGALSGKTGFTGTAGYCYVGALRRDGKTYIVALLACGWPNNKSYKWADTKKLMNYGIEAFTRCDLDAVAIDETYLAPIPVENGRGAWITDDVSVEVTLQENGFNQLSTLLIPNGEEIEVRYELAKKLSAPVKAGACVGRVRFMLGEETLREYLVVTKNAVEKIDFAWCRRLVWEGLLL